jgi:glycosyltransferase involved in cell wall biosynthesis
MNLPLVSFIIPYHNAGATIQDTVDSIFNQTYQNFDVWIVNDGSTDPFSIEKLKDFDGNEKIHILHQENAGPGSARNLAIQRSKAEFIVPLDADDLIDSNSVAKSLNVFKNNEIGAVYGNIQYFGEEATVKIQADFKIDRQLIMNQIAVTALIRKVVFDDVGLYDLILSKPGLEDWEFWIRMGQSSWKIQKLEMIFFQARIQNSSRTYQVANKNLNFIQDYVYKKHVNLVMKNYNDLYYQKKQLLETPDYRIGNFILAPYRFFKKKIFKNG